MQLTHHAPPPAPLTERHTAAGRHYRPIVKPAMLMVAVIVDAWLLLSMAGWTVGGDGYSAWSLDLDQPYATALTSMIGIGPFRWSPAAAQVLYPLTFLPWTAWMLAFLGLQLAAIRLVAGRRWPYVVLFPPTLLGLYSMNIDLLMGLAIAASFRWPGWWAVPILGKLTTGIGVLWFAFRREWRSFALALGVTAGVVAVSFAIVPHLWFQWADALRVMSALPQSALGPPLAVRLVMAVAVLWYAARTDRAWLVPVACFLAVPNPWLVTTAILAGSVALWRATPAGAPAG
jgi:hypothetical protein